MKDRVYKVKTQAAEGPGLADIVLVILSPVIVAGLTLTFLLGWWVEAALRWLASPSPYPRPPGERKKKGAFDGDDT